MNDNEMAKFVLDWMSDNRRELRALLSPDQWRDMMNAEAVLQGVELAGWNRELADNAHRLDQVRLKLSSATSTIQQSHNRMENAVQVLGLLGDLLRLAQTLNASDPVSTDGDE